MISFIAHSISALSEMNEWMFSENSHLGKARFPYLLTPIGWLALCVIAQQAKLTDAWGIEFDAICFGIGCFTYVIVTVSVLQNLHGEYVTDTLPSPLQMNLRWSSVRSLRPLRIHQRN